MMTTSDMMIGMNHINNNEKEGGYNSMSADTIDRDLFLREREEIGMRTSAHNKMASHMSTNERIEKIDQLQSLAECTRFMNALADELLPDQIRLLAARIDYLEKYRKYASPNAICCVDSDNE